MMCLLKVACILLAALTLNAQEDYGARGAGMARRRNNRGPLITVVLAGVCGWTVGSWLSDSSAAKKYQAKKLPLLEYIQQQEQTAQLRETQYKKQYQKLYREYERMERESTERDYEEFKAPDTDGDDMISRVEFNTYVRKYLSSFPELTEKDFPKFEEFDLNHDGVVSFDEWQGFLVQQKADEAAKKKSEATGAKKAGDGSQYDALLQALYEQSNQADSFNSLQKNIASGTRGGGGGAVRRA
jgi:hypothetical protein